MSAAGSEIESHGDAAAIEMLQPLHMGLRQIVHMDVVTHTSAVRRGVLVSEDFERRTLTANRFESGRDQVSLGRVHLADGALFICPRRIEIAKAHIAQTISWSVGLQCPL